jgi:diguanylate cyclase (GGDEF)-like protein
LKLSIRGAVKLGFGILLGAVCIVGVLAASASVRSAHQATAFRNDSVVPLLGLNVEIQDIDQERDLLGADVADMRPQKRRAVWDELTSLDISISRGSDHILPIGSHPQWQLAWSRYLTARAHYLSILHPGVPRRTITRNAARVSNRLYGVLDLLQSESGVKFAQAEELYLHDVNTDWSFIQASIGIVLLVLMLGLTCATLIIRRLTRGFENVIETAQAITDGKREVRADVAGHDEISLVARAFNHMTDTLLSLEQSALTEPLTGLGNHRAFHEALPRALARAYRHGHQLSMALIDLDDFKSINDQHGHAHGDWVLVELARHLRAGRVEDPAFRLGGDEFALILPYTDRNDAARRLERIRLAVGASLNGATLSVGITELTEDLEDAETLREQADAALYDAKRRGRNRTVAFEDIRAHAAIVSPAKIQAVRNLLADGQITIVFQPIWNIDCNEVLGYEALMRPLPDTGLNGPQEVFDIAEKLGRAPELDQVCLRAILARAHELPPRTLLFINLSPQSLDGGMLKTANLLEAVECAGLAPSRVVFEITERSVARVETVVREARRLRALGFHLALDDVGAGNAGLDMLRRVAVDFVKIDRSVIAQALTDEGAAGVLSGIIAFARRTGTFVIAEGIETQAMLDIVQVAGLPDTSDDTGIQGVQGYLFGRPADVIEPMPVESDTIISFDQRTISHG